MIKSFKARAFSTRSIFIPLFIIQLIVIPYLYSQNADYIGTAVGKNIDDAKNSALNSLVQQIQVFVTSKTATEKSESLAALKDSIFINTVAQSFMSLTDVSEKIEKLSDGSFKVTKSVSRASVKRMFNERRNRIIDYIREAERIRGQQTDTMNIPLQVLLNNYFQAYLLRLLYPDTISYNFSNRTALVEVGIPNTIEEIARNIEFMPIKQIDDEYVVWKYRVRYKGKEVSHLRYSYFDGMGQSEGEVVNGETQITLYYTSKEKKQRLIQVQVEFPSAEELDNTLGIAQKFLNTSILQKTVIVTIPGERSVAVGSIKNPIALDGLIKMRTNLKGIRDELNELIKKGAIVQGRASDFESLNGLYCTVLDTTGLIALLKNEKNKYYDFLSGRNVELKEYAGMRIMWFELLKK